MARLEQLINWTTAKLDAALRNPVYPLLFSIYPVLFLYQHNAVALSLSVAVTLGTGQHRAIVAIISYLQFIDEGLTRGGGIQLDYGKGINFDRCR